MIEPGELAEIVAKLDEMVTEQSPVSAPAFKALMDSNAITTLDLFVSAILNRSASTIAGIRDLCASQNFTAAAALVRLQLDNVIRFHAFFLAPDVFEFVAAFIAGTPIKDLEDERGRKMTDSYLRTHFTGAAPWIDQAYKTASGYIHLSEQHIFASTTRDGGSVASPGTIPVTIKVSPKDTSIGKKEYDGMLGILEGAWKLLQHQLLEFLKLRAHHYPSTEVDDGA